MSINNSAERRAKGSELYIKHARSIVNDEAELSLAHPNIPVDFEHNNKYAAGNKMPSVAILLCTKEGQKFLREQLSSIRDQNYGNLTIQASDDGSQDQTCQILQQHQFRWGKDRFSIYHGPKRGYAANFLSLICRSEIQADYYAFADQDDIWEADKIARATTWLETVPSNIPAMYCSRTRLIDENNKPIGYSMLFKKPPAFANAIVQNIAAGNTIIMNQSARDLICAAGESVTVVSHDWWAYLLITAAGGAILYDVEPTVAYRQHNGNLLGSNAGWVARFLRIRMLLQGRFKNWNNLNINALMQMQQFLTSENQQVLNQFSAARQRWLIPRLYGIWKAGIYRQTLLGNLGLLAAALLKKI